MQDQPDELFLVVDDNDTILGTERRAVVHARGLRHRSVHVLVFNPAGELLIQLRSAAKDSYPLHWDNSVGGHVGPGETYEQAAARELAEELGLRGPLRFLRKTPASAQTGWEFTCLYQLTTDAPVCPDRDEIVRCEFIAPRRLLAEIRSGARRATPALLDALIFYLQEEPDERGHQQPAAG